MFITFKKTKRSGFQKIVTAIILITFFVGTICPPQLVHAQTIPQTNLNLPVPGTMVPPSRAYVPILLKGMTIHPEDPLRFDFIVDSGNSNESEKQIKQVSEKLVKYFLAAMTVPKDDLWVNLSPHEAGRIIPEELGKTELGRDMLAQDYILKQLTASLMYPEKELGKKFWNKIYAKVQARFGTTEIPLNTFNKVWILPDSAIVYENGQTVYVVESRLKVLLDEDYLALDKNGKKDVVSRQTDDQYKDSAALSSQIVREIILPEIEREVNEGENFATLRQIYHSLILSKWYKETIHESLLSQVYVDQKKIVGVEGGDPAIKEKIYHQYMDAYKQGVFNFIKEDYDELSQRVIPRKYFSGGEEFDDIPLTRTRKDKNYDTTMVGGKYSVSMRLNPQLTDDGSNGGLIGKYKILSDIDIDRTANEIRFSGQHIETEQEEEVVLRIAKVISKEEVIAKLGDIKNHPFVNEMIAWFNQQDEINDVFVFERNPYEIHGLAEQQMMGISADFEDEPLAYLHEIGEAMGAAGQLSFATVLVNVEDQEWYRTHVQKSNRKGMELHYALRALFREMYLMEDLNFTHTIKRIHEYELENTDLDEQDALGRAALLKELAEKHNNIVEAKAAQRIQEQEFIAQQHRFKMEWDIRYKTNAEIAEAIVDIYQDNIDIRLPRSRFDTFHDFVADTFAESHREVLVLVIQKIYDRLMNGDIQFRDRVYFLALLSIFIRKAPKLNAQEASQITDIMSKDLKANITEVSVKLDEVADIRNFDQFFSYTKDEEKTSLSRLQRFQSYMLRHLPAFMPQRPERVYFRENFQQKVKKVRSGKLKERLLTLHDDANRERHVIREIYTMLITQYEENAVWGSLADLFVKGDLDVEQRLFILSIISRRMSHGYDADKVQRLIEKAFELDKKVKNTEQKRQLLQTIMFYAAHPGGKSIERRRIYNHIIEDMPQHLSEASRYGRDLDVYDQQSGGRSGGGIDDYTDDDPLTDLLTKHYLSMLDVFWRTRALIQLARNALNDEKSFGFAEEIITYLIDILKDPRWDQNVKSEIITALDVLLDGGNTQIVAFLNKELGGQLHSNAFFRADDELETEVLPLLKSTQLNERAGYLLIKSYKSRLHFLRSIINSPDIDIRYRLYAFALYAGKYRPRNMGPGGEIVTEKEDPFEEEELKAIIDLLTPEAEVFLKEFAQDHERINRLVNDIYLQDEEAKVYAMGVLVILQNNMQLTSADILTHIAQRISNARLIPYMDNANDAFMLGGRILKSSSEQATLLLQIIAHEIMHVVLFKEHEYSTFTLKQSMIHETLSDVLSFILSDILGLDINVKTQASKYKKLYKDVKKDHFHSIQQHEGARAQLHLLRGRLKALGVTLDWQQLLRTGVRVVTDPLVQSRSLEETMAIWIRAAYLESNRMTRIKHHDFYQRFFNVPATEEPEELLKVRILDKKGVDKSLQADAAMLGNWLRNRKVKQLIVEKLDDQNKSALITEFHIEEARTFLNEGDDFDVIYHEQIGSSEIIGVMGSDGLYWGADVDAETGRSVNFKPARLEIIRGKPLEEVDGAMLVKLAQLREVGRAVLNLPYVSKFVPDSSWLPSLRNLSAAIVIVGMCTACAVNPARSPLVNTALGEEYLEQVIKDLESDYSSKRTAAYFYIFDLGPDDTFALTYLNEALESDLSEESKKHIRRSIEKITFVDPQSRPSLIQVVEDGTSTDAQLLNAYRRLKDMGWSPRTLEEQVMSHYFNIEWDKIVEIGQPAVPVLMELLSKSDREWAARILNDLGWMPQTLEEKLYFYLGRNQVDKIRALGPPTIPLLARIVTSADVESQVSRSRAIRALGLFTGEDAAMKPLIRKAAVDPDPIIRDEAEIILLGSQRSVKLSSDEQSGQVFQLNAKRGRFSEPYLLNDFLDNDSPSRVNSARLLAKLTVSTESMKRIIEAVQAGDPSLDQPLKWKPYSWNEERMPGVRNLLARITADFWNDRELLADYILPTIFDVLMEQPTHFMTIDIMIKERRLLASMDEAAYQQVYQRLNTRDQRLWRVFYLVSRFDGSHYHQPPYAGVDMPERVNQDFQDGQLREAINFLEGIHPEIISDFLIGYMSDTRGTSYNPIYYRGLPASDVYFSYVRHALLVGQSTVLKLLYRDGRILRQGNYRGVQASKRPGPDKDILDAYQSPEVVWTDRDIRRLKGLLNSPIEYYRDAARRALDAIEKGERIIPYTNDEAMLGSPWTLRGARKILNNQDKYSAKMIQRAIDKLGQSGTRSDIKRLKKLGYVKWVNIRLENARRVLDDDENYSVSEALDMLVEVGTVEDQKRIEAKGYAQWIYLTATETTESASMESGVGGVFNQTKSTVASKRVLYGSAEEESFRRIHTFEQGEKWDSYYRYGEVSGSGPIWEKDSDVASRNAKTDDQAMLGSIESYSLNGAVRSGALSVYDGELIATSDNAMFIDQIIQTAIENPLTTGMVLGGAMAVIGGGSILYWKRRTISGNIWRLRHADERTAKLEAIKFLTQSKSQRAVNALIEVVSAEYDFDELRLPAIEALGNIGLRTAIKPLLDLLGEQKDTVYESVLTNLKKLKATHDQMVDGYIAQLTELNISVLRRTVIALEQLNDVRAIEPLIEAEIIEAIALMKKLGATTDQLVEANIRLLKHDNLDGKIAVDDLGKLGRDKAIVPLSNALSSRHQDTRRAIPETLDILGASREQKISGYAKALSSNLDAHNEAVEALTDLGVGQNQLNDLFLKALSKSGGETYESILNKLVKQGDIRVIEPMIRRLPLHAESIASRLKNLDVSEKHLDLIAAQRDRLNKRFENDGEYAQDYNAISDVLYALGDSRGNSIYVYYDEETAPDPSASMSYHSGDYIVVKHARWEKEVRSDQAQLSEVGGIDLNQVPIERQGAGVNIQFNQTTIQPILDQGVEGFAPEIINIIPIQSIMPLLGLESDQTEEFDVSSNNREEYSL